MAQKSSTNAFPKQARLLSSEQFRAVFDNRLSAADTCLIVYAAPNNLPFSRLGLAVSRKIGNAVVRNRWKRQIREAFRLQQGILARGYDWVILPKRGAEPLHGLVATSLVKLTRRLEGKRSHRTDGQRKKKGKHGR